MSEELLRDVSEVLVTIVEAVGACVIFIGAIWAALRFLVLGVRHRTAAVFTPIRLMLGRFLTLGLEFQLAADVLRTAVAPSFEQIGQLAAIATIRTVLNYFLRREIEQEQRQIAARGPAYAGSGPTGQPRQEAT
ncbi:DUF1622 domain-containing protein [Micromonospora sp. NBC_01699]|uniref:DUF1622 domain-containing protein n=1 Tax=Micromonospora sp. NBC_01699 TaxID=2975984 RepID=UPI002E31B36A|nr:DUF1622 domain-containing protein [Micromonospora sp. NBC_01699]